LRSTTRASVTATGVTYDLDVDTYDYLRVSATLCPRLLVLFVMPENESEWLQQSTSELCLRHCPYWLSLAGAPATTATSTLRIVLPLTNLFSVDTVRALLQQAVPGSPS